MPPKVRTPSAPKTKADATAGLAPRLVPLTTPGTYLNEQGIVVGSDGVAIAFRQLRQTEGEYFHEVLGKEVETPAELMKAVALDPRQPLLRRLEAAKNAAPYFDKKTPTAIETPATDALAKLDFSKLSDSEIALFLTLAEKLGLTPSEESEG